MAVDGPSWRELAIWFLIGIIITLVAILIAKGLLNNKSVQKAPYGCAYIDLDSGRKLACVNGYPAP